VFCASDLDFAMVDPSEVRANEFKILRAQAIENYAAIEQALASLFTNLLGTSRDKGGVVFFRITNASSRNKIISALLKKAQGDKYNAVWHGENGVPGLIVLIRQLDQARNELVHWHMVHKVYAKDDGAVTREPVLRPPNFWDRNPDTPEIDEPILSAFVAKADFVSRALNMLNALIEDTGFLTNVEIPWPQIFCQPIVYPPPDTHPLSRNYIGLRTPPPASEV
jgi:hypothetical protein